MLLMDATNSRPGSNNRQSAAAAGGGGRGSESSEVNADNYRRLLESCTDGNINIINIKEAIRLLDELEHYEMKTEELFESRLGKYINKLRKNTSNVLIAKKAKNLVKAWQKLIPVSKTSNPSIPKIISPAAGVDANSSGGSNVKKKPKLSPNFNAKNSNSSEDPSIGPKQQIKSPDSKINNQPINKLKKTVKVSDEVILATVSSEESQSVLQPPKSPQNRSSVPASQELLASSLTAKQQEHGILMVQINTKIKDILLSITKDAAADAAAVTSQSPSELSDSQILSIIEPKNVVIGNKKLADLRPTISNVVFPFVSDLLESTES
ncbi:MAG: Mediator of RNA polymerase II transcription, subunit [Marteilia pararefringens]